MFEWNIYILCFITLTTGFLIHFTRGIYSKTKPDNMLNLWSFNLYQNVFALATVLIIFISSNMLGSFSWYSVKLGVLMGIANVMSLYASLKAYAVGPFSYTTVVVSLSVIMPALSGLFYGESISPVQYAGVLMMILCIILSPENNADNNKSSVKWLIWSVIASMVSGLVGIFQKVHQGSLQHSFEMSALLISCFTTSVIICFICYLHEITKLKKKTICREKISFVHILCGFSNAVSHSINIFLVGILPAIIIFPVVNLVPMIFLILSSVLIFKEKLSIRRWMGVASGIISTLLLSGILNY